MTPDELKSMPKGQFVVMKTGFYPMKVRLKLFFEWGIEFDKDNPYTIADQGNRQVVYAEKRDIMDAIVKKYRPELIEPTAPPEDSTKGGQSENMSENNEAKGESKKNQNKPQSKPNQEKKEKNKSGGTNVRSGPRERRDQPILKNSEGEVSENGQS